jgi:hypothetical protein
MFGSRWDRRLNADGTVRSAIPTEPHEPFASLAAKAALNWRFEGEKDLQKRAGQAALASLRLLMARVTSSDIRRPDLRGARLVLLACRG